MPCYPGWSGIYNVVESDLELLILPSPLLKIGDYRCVQEDTSWLQVSSQVLMLTTNNSLIAYSITKNHH